MTNFNKTKELLEVNYIRIKNAPSFSEVPTIKMEITLYLSMNPVILNNYLKELCFFIENKMKIETDLDNREITNLEEFLKYVKTEKTSFDK